VKYGICCVLHSRNPGAPQRGIKKNFFIMSQFLKILDFIFNFITFFLSFTYGLTYMIQLWKKWLLCDNFVFQSRIK